MSPHQFYTAVISEVNCRLQLPGVNRVSSLSEKGDFSAQDKVSRSVLNVPNKFYTAVISGASSPSDMGGSGPFRSYTSTILLIIPLPSSLTLTRLADRQRPITYAQCTHK